MHGRDPRLDVTSRVRDAHERPREYNDPSRLDTQTIFYRGRHTHWLQLLILTVAALGMLGLVGFVAFNLIF